MAGIRSYCRLGAPAAVACGGAVEAVVVIRGPVCVCVCVRERERERE